MIYEGDNSVVHRASDTRHEPRFLSVAGDGILRTKLKTESYPERSSTATHSSCLWTDTDGANNRPHLLPLTADPRGRWAQISFLRR